MEKVKVSGRSFLSGVAGVFAGLAVLSALPALAGIVGLAALSGEAIIWGAVLSLGFGGISKAITSSVDKVRPLPFVLATALTVAAPFVVVHQMTRKSELPEKNKLEITFNQSAAKQDNSNTYQYTPQQQSTPTTPGNR